MAGDWNYLAGRFTGDGGIEIVETELPINLQGVTTNLSAPASLSGEIPYEVTRLKAAGRPIFEAGNTVLLVEASGVLRAMALYESPRFNGARWNWEAAGPHSYLTGLPYDGEIEFYKQDPLNIYRHIWEHAQDRPYGNLGITVDPLTSLIRVGGTPPTAPAETIGDAAQYILDRYNSGQPINADWSWMGMPTVVQRYHLELYRWYTRPWDANPRNPADLPAVKAWLAKYVADRKAEPVAEPVIDRDEEDPWRLNWWSTPDLGAVVDSLAKETPFDWYEHVYWDGDVPRCHMRLGHPIIGERRESYRIVLGENLAIEPDVSQPTYLNEVHVLGNGEGRARVRGYAVVADGKLRRARVIEDESITTKTGADARASLELAAARGKFKVDSLTIFDHPNLPLDAVELGMEVPLYAETDHVTVDDFVRVVGKSEAPETGDRATLTVVRVGAPE